MTKPALSSWWSLPVLALLFCSAKCQNGLCQTSTSVERAFSRGDLVQTIRIAHNLPTSFVDVSFQAQNEGVESVLGIIQRSTDNPDEIPFIIVGGWVLQSLGELSLTINNTLDITGLLPTTADPSSSSFEPTHTSSSSEPTLTSSSTSSQTGTDGGDDGGFYLSTATSVTGSLGLVLTSLAAIFFFSHRRVNACMVFLAALVFTTGNVILGQQTQPTCLKVIVTVRVPSTITQFCINDYCNDITLTGPVIVPPTTGGSTGGGSTGGGSTGGGSSSTTTTSSGSTTGVSSTTGGNYEPIVIEGISKTQFCAEEGDVIILTGSGFNGVNAYTRRHGEQNSVLSFILNQNGSHLEMLLWGSPTGYYDLIVSRASTGESVELLSVLEYHKQLYIFFADPPAVYNGISFQVTFYATGLEGPIDTIVLTGPAGNKLHYNASQVTQVPGKWNQVQAVIPAGTPVGEYEMSLRSAVGCYISQSDIITVTNTLSIPISRVDPPFVWNQQNEGMSVFGPPELTAGQVAFQSVPRLFLNPNPAGPQSLAVPLRATVWNSATNVQAVVEEGQLPGNYDFVMVNPDGTVGILQNAVTVVQDAPPVVEAIVPGFLNSNEAGQVTLYGQNFDTTNPTISMICKPWSTPTAPDVTYNAVTVTRKNATEIDVNLPGNQAGDGSICVVRVQNGDGSYFDYQAIVVRTPANKMKAWQHFPGETTIEARRGLSTVSGFATTNSKFLYVVGGDNGALTGGKNTIEVSPLDRFGGVQGFFTQRNRLPNHLSFGTLVRVSRFLYYIGGWDSLLNAPSERMYRAEILDPLKTPGMDIDVALAEGNVSPLKGIVYYRVAALFAANDPNNPAGESVAGEIFTLILPRGNTGVIVHLQLLWNQIPDAIGYRLYRTPAPDMTANDLELLVELMGPTNTQYLDEGGATDPTVRPIRIGETGIWHEVTSMSTRRWGHSSFASPSKTLDDNYFLTSIGGKDQVDTLLSTYEQVRITVTPPAGALIREFQTVGNEWQFINGAGALAPVRFLFGAARVGGEDLTGLGFDDSAVVVGPGWNGVGAAGITKTWLGAVVQKEDTGDFDGPWQIITDSPAQTYGYCLFQAFGLVHIIGGVDGGTPFPGSTALPSYGRILPNPGLCQDPSNMWECSNWSGEPFGSIKRAFSGCGRENALFYLVGGTTDGQTVPTNQVWRVPQ